MTHHAFPSLGAIARHSIVRSDFGISLRDAAAMMDENGVSSIVIESGNNRYVFSVEDLLNFMHHGGRSENTLGSFPVRALACLPENERLLSALEYLEKNGLRHIGVTDADGKLTGIVTNTDILSSIDPAILLERKTIGEMLSRADPVMFTPDWILEDVMHHFRRSEDSIIVIENDKPAGIVTTRDVFEAISSGRDIEKPLGHFMTSPVATTPASATIGEALAQLKRLRIKRAIVVDESGMLLGIISQSELIGYAYGAWMHILKEHSSELKELAELLENKTVNPESPSMTETWDDGNGPSLLHQMMAQEISRIGKQRTSPFSLVLADIGNLDAIVEHHGPQTVSWLFDILGRGLKSWIRQSDIAFRLGEGRFALLLPETGLNEASLLMQRIRGKIGELPFGEGISPAISLALGEWRANEDEFEVYDRVEKMRLRLGEDALPHARPGRNQETGHSRKTGHSQNKQNKREGHSERIDQTAT